MKHIMKHIATALVYTIGTVIGVVYVAFYLAAAVMFVWCTACLVGIAVIAVMTLFHNSTCGLPLFDLHYFIISVREFPLIRMLIFLD